MENSELLKEIERLKEQNKILAENNKEIEKQFIEAKMQSDLFRSLFSFLIHHIPPPFKEYVKSNDGLGELKNIIEAGSLLLNSPEYKPLSKDELDGCVMLMFGELVSKLQNRAKAPKVKKEKTDEFWKKYRSIFKKYLQEGKSESWAMNKIGDLIEQEGTWVQSSKKNPHTQISRPNRSTLRRQLIK